MIWIVGGPSSAGKSTFLDSPRAAAVTGLPRGTRVFFPKDVVEGAAVGRDAFVHYNVLRPFQRAARPGDVPIDERLFAGDAGWRAIVALPGEKRAAVVVADRRTLVERVRKRAVIEAGDGHEYGAAKWLAIYEKIDVDAVVREWRAELARRAIPSVDVDGGSGA